MDYKSLKDLVRKVLSSGLAVGGASQSLSALPVPSAPTSGTSLDHAFAPADATKKDVILRAARPKVLLRALDATRMAVISSHRSHRSHSSHRSSSSGGSPVSPPRRAPSRPRATDDNNSAQKPLSIMGGDADTAALGSRVLVRGMRGKDVEQLIILLVKLGRLSPERIPMESLFNEDVESSVKKFQADKGLTSDGKVDFRTLLLLKAQ